MNMMLVLLGMCLFAGIVSVWVGLRNGREGRVLKRAARKGIPYLVVGFTLASCMAGSAQAQEVIHAVTGTLTAASASENTFSIKTDDGSIALFNALAVKKTPISFSKEVEAQTVAANTFHEVGAHVLVFYYGFNTVRTAVAIRNLGIDPLNRITGSVKGFDRHSHSMAIDGAAAGPVDLILTGDTIIDTPNGVVEGLKYHPNKGERVGAIIKSIEGAKTAVFVSATGPNASMS